MIAQDFKAQAKISLLDVKLLVETGRMSTCEIIGTNEGKWVVLVNNDFVLETARGKAKYFASILTALEALHAAGVQVFTVNMQNWENMKTQKNRKG